MTLDPRQLTAFLGVVEHGSVGRAAQALNITQPALTRSIKRLEQVVGVPLFSRQSTGMVLTSFGEVFEHRARLLQSETDAALRELRALGKAEPDVVRIGAVSSAAETLLSDLIDKYLADAPGTNLSIFIGLEEELHGRLLKGELDLVIAFELREDDELELLICGPVHDGCKIVSAVKHPLQRRSGLFLSDLIRERWVLTPVGTALRREFTDVFTANNLSPPLPRVESQSVLMTKILVSRAGFLAWLPAMLLAEREAEDFAVVQVNLPLVEQRRRFGVYKRRRGLLNLGFLKFLKELRPRL